VIIICTLKCFRFQRWMRILRPLDPCVKQIQIQLRLIFISCMLHHHQLSHLSDDHVTKRNNYFSQFDSLTCCLYHHQSDRWTASLWKQQTDTYYTYYYILLIQRDFKLEISPWFNKAIINYIFTSWFLTPKSIKNIFLHVMYVI